MSSWIPGIKHPWAAGMEQAEQPGSSQERVTPPELHTHRNRGKTRIFCPGKPGFSAPTKSWIRQPSLMQKKQLPGSSQAQTCPHTFQGMPALPPAVGRDRIPRSPGIPHLLGLLQPLVSLPLPAPSRCLFWKDVELLWSPLPGSSSQPFHPLRLCRNRKGATLRTSGGFQESSAQAGKEPVLGRSSVLRKAAPGSPVCVRITPIPAVESWDPLLEQGSTSQPTDNRIFPPGTTP